MAKTGRRLVALCFSIFVFLVVGGTAVALDIDLGGKNLKINGFLNQGVSFGIAGDEYDNKEGFQSAYYDLLLEAEYWATDDLKIFVSGMMSGDWAYDILHDNDEWEEKGFAQAYDEMAHDTELRDILQEAHATLNVGNFRFRVGKQIISWGETDGFRIMDQINPVDQRRGLTDVEFESTILPIWLVQGEYYWQTDSTWLQDLSLEVVFNPNADFQANRNIVPGNDTAGVWAPHLESGLGGPYPFDYAHVGHFNIDMDEPGDWDSDGFEYGVRLKGIILDNIITLNYFYGLNNDYVVTNKPLPPNVSTSDYDGRMIIDPHFNGEYSLFRTAGATFTGDFESLNISALGGVAPVLRLEGFYGFSNTFETSVNTLEQFDEIRMAVGVDWKIKVPFLNPRAYFFISPQLYYRGIVDCPNDYQLSEKGGTWVEDDNYQTSLMISTTYFHNKLEPSFFWLRDITQNSNFFRLQLKYEYSDVWNFTLGASFFDGKTLTQGFEPLENKDHIYCTVGFRF
jgi:hypothetical protein